MEEFIMKQIFAAFRYLSQNNYTEMFGNSVITMIANKLEVEISKPCKEPFPQFLNVCVKQDDQKIGMDILTEILTDMCERNGLLDNKLKMKLNTLITGEPMITYVDGRRIEIK